MGNLPSKKRSVRFPKNIDDKLLFDEEEEIDRVQVEHHMYRTLWGGNFLAPVRDVLLNGGASVLDFGCGPGTWICDMSSDFPKSSFIGVEIIPLFPTIHPSNVQFIQCDLNNGLPFSDNQFDFVHMRLKYINYTKDQWRNMVIRELVRVLKPGGWVEVFELECDGINNGPISKQYVKIFREAALKKNIDPDLVFHLPEIIASTDGVDRSTICHASKVVPLGSWGGKIGELVRQNTVEFMRKINVVLHVPETKSEDLVKRQDEELNIYKTSIRLHKFYARKEAFVSGLISHGTSHNSR